MPLKDVEPIIIAAYNDGRPAKDLIESGKLSKQDALKFADLWINISRYVIHGITEAYPTSASELPQDPVGDIVKAQYQALGILP